MYGPPTLSLQNFIGCLLVEAIGNSTSLPTFYCLVEEYGLIVYDKVIDVYDKVIEGQLVSLSELLGTLRQREQLVDKSFDDDSFQFWETLTLESKYSVFRDHVAMAYRDAGKLEFPWFNMNGELVWLSTGEQNIRNLKQKELGVEDIIEKSVKELLALSRCQQDRKRTLVAVADNEDDVIELLYDLEGLKNSKEKLEAELCRVKTASYQFEESRKTEIKLISKKITEIDQWLDHYQATGKLQDLTTAHDELETPSSKCTQTSGLGAATPLNTTSETLGAVTNMLKPWLIADPKDPQPELTWYIPARYFARQLIIEDPSLLKKRDILANRIVKTLTAAGFKKRGGKLPYNPTTIKKALSNISLG